MPAAKTALRSIDPHPPSAKRAALRLIREEQRVPERLSAVHWQEPIQIENMHLLPVLAFIFDIDGTWSIPKNCTSIPGIEHYGDSANNTLGKNYARRSVKARTNIYPSFSRPKKS